ncbi:coiled-coil domain-containing protein [Methylocaldum sp.]|uniref:coiled-coil domain-containing protein n=1 Tax=Methylocaldum sp. TaxID=1969727 RepID=UPI002D4BBC83|nr:coiled-coil domain-containing protein [Methylocaldum sp.]HYE35218.1 coiled-coil domain-containing protein [Methylocaldum sp.]
MTSITFDTHKFVRRLKESGFTEEQAEAMADAFKEAQGEAELATKQDLRELEYRLTSKPGGMMIAAVGIVATLDKIL